MRPTISPPEVQAPTQDDDAAAGHRPRRAVRRATRTRRATSSPARSASARSAAPASRPACATGVSFVLEQGRIRIVVTGALHQGSEIARHHAEHGDGVKVDRAVGARRRARLPRGDPARRARHPRAVGGVRTSTAPCACSQIATYGETLHTFVERTDYDGRSSPASRRRRRTARPARTCWSASTTWSATSSWGGWTSGSPTTSACSASPR